MIEFPKPDVEEMLQTVSIIDFAVSPDEKQLIFCTNISGKYNLWAMDLPNAFPYRLTFNNQPCHELLYDQEGRFVIAGFDHDGDENTQFYALKPHGGALKKVVYQENTRNFSPQLSSDGERLYYSSSKENSSYLNTYCLQLSTGEETTVLEGSGGTTYIAEVSEDETTTLYYRFFSNTNTRYYARVGDEEILLTPPTEKEHTVSFAVLTSPTEVYLVTDYEADFSYLAKFDLETKTFTKVKEIPKEGFTTLIYDKENRILYETGMEKLGFFDLETKSLTMPRHLSANYLAAKIPPQECVVKSLGVIFQPTLFAKAFFKNIKASDGIDEGVLRSYSVLSIQLLFRHITSCIFTCKEFLYLYIIILYINITFIFSLFHGFSWFYNFSEY